MTLLQLFLYFSNLKPLDGELFIDSCLLCTQHVALHEPYSVPLHLEQELPVPDRYTAYIEEEAQW